MTFRNPPLARRSPARRAGDNGRKTPARPGPAADARAAARLRGSDTADPFERDADARASAALSDRAGSPAGPTARAAPTHTLEGLGSGEALDSETRGQMEDRFNADFSDVRVHSGASAKQMAEGFDAEAFAVGNHIVFGKEQRHGSPEHRALLAHELAHVLQPQEAAAPALVRRQPKQPGGGIQGLKPVYFKKVRELLLTRDGVDSDTMALVRRLDLTSTAPQKIRTVTAAGRTMEFNLTLRWIRTAGSRTVPLPPGPSAPAGANFEIAIGYDFAGRFAGKPVPEHSYYGKAVQGSPVDRNALLMAEALYHELLHLQIQMDKVIAASDPGAAFSEAFSQYVTARSYLQEVQKPRYVGLRGAEVAAAESAIQRLVLMMCADVPAPRTIGEADRQRLAKRALGFFVQEKYAFWRTAGVFGPAPDNQGIAHSYVRNLFAEVLDADPAMGMRVFDNLETTRRRPNGFFGDLAQELERHVRFLFSYLDTELMRPGERSLR